MPALPSGGLLMFINLIILIVGLIGQGLQRLGVKTSLLTRAFSPMVDKSFDGQARQLFAYSVVMMVVIIITTIAALSIELGVKNDSNYEVLATFIDEGNFYETLSSTRGIFSGILFNSNSLDISTERMSDMEIESFLQDIDEHSGRKKENERLQSMSKINEEIATSPNI